jgi:hypothetical protein
VTNADRLPDQDLHVALTGAVIAVREMQDIAIPERGARDYGYPLLLELDLDLFV